MAESHEAPIRWRIHLTAGPDTVFDMLATQRGRERFWAESAPQDDGTIRFTFPDGTTQSASIETVERPRRFGVEYFGGSAVFELSPTEANGTDLTLTHRGIGADEWCETNAGWVSVLLALKAATDHGIDLRNHDPDRTWADGFVDN